MYFCFLNEKKLDISTPLTFVLLVSDLRYALYFRQICTDKRKNDKYHTLLYKALMSYCKERTQALPATIDFFLSLCDVKPAISTVD